MNYLQKQAALQKLAQVRLAVNYVLRNRGMMKRAGEPQFGEPGYVAPEYQWMKRFDEVMRDSPNRASIWTNTKQPGAPDRLENASVGFYHSLPERLSLPVGHPNYVSPNDPAVQRTIAENAAFYNLGDPDGVYAPSVSVWSPKDKPGSQTNFLPIWGIDSIMNAKTPREKVQQGQNWILNQGGRVYK